MKISYADDEVQVATGTHLNKQISLFDLTGRQVLLMNNIEDELIKIPVSDFKRGIYMIQVSTPAGMYADKIIAR